MTSKEALNEELLDKESEEMMEIAGELLMDGCDNCTFYELEKCDSKPINCCWLKLHILLKHYEKKDEGTDEDK